MRTVGTGGIDRLQAQHGMAMLAYRARYVVERLARVQANRGGLAARHLLDQQLRADEGHRADVARYIEVVLARIFFSRRVFVLLHWRDCARVNSGLYIRNSGSKE